MIKQVPLNVVDSALLNKEKDLDDNDDEGREESSLH